MTGYAFTLDNFWLFAALRRDAAIPDVKMREGSVASSVWLTFRKWLFDILINKRPNLASARPPVNWKLFEGEYETHIHYGRTSFLPLITTQSNDISVCLLSHMQIIFTSVTLLCVVFIRRSLMPSNASLSFSHSPRKIYSSVIAPFGLMLSMSSASCRRATRRRNGRIGGKRFKYMTERRAKENDWKDESGLSPFTLFVLLFRNSSTSCNPIALKWIAP